MARGRSRPTTTHSPCGRQVTKKKKKKKKFTRKKKKKKKKKKKMKKNTHTIDYHLG